MRLIRTLLCVALVVLPSTLLGQSYTGTIIGTLKDTSGAVIPAANVTITNATEEPLVVLQVAAPPPKD